MRSRSVKTFLLGFLGALLVLGPSAAWPADTVFPDKNLEAVVRTYVPKKRANEEPLTVDDVKDLARIDARGKGIKDLTGLDQCIGIEAMDLSGNEITDLTPLAKLASVKKTYAPTEDTYLQLLILAKNKITDLKPLSGLLKLQYLDLADNQITDISPLAKLTMVNTLHLTNNKVKDLSPLAGMQRLWTLEADGNAIVDISDDRLDAVRVPDTSRFGFEVTSLQVQLRGLCRACRKRLAPMSTPRRSNAPGRMWARYLRCRGGLQVRQASGEKSWACSRFR